MKKIYILLLFVVNLAVGQSVVISPNSLSRTAGISNDISILKYSDDYPTILGIRSGGTAASPTNSTNAMRLLAINAAGKETGSTYIQSNINFFTTENWTNTNRGTKITFGTTTNGTTTLSEKMVINHDGKVGIGITVPAEQLHVVGNIRSSNLAGTGNRPVYANANGNIVTGAEQNFINITPYDYIHSFPTGSIINLTRDHHEVYPSVTSPVPILARAPLHLPHGATVTGFSQVFIDTDNSYYIQGEIRRVPKDRSFLYFAPMIANTSSGNVSTATIFNSTGASFVVDNDNYYYYFEVSTLLNPTSSGVWTNTMKAGVAVITYTF